MFQLQFLELVNQLKQFSFTPFISNLLYFKIHSQVPIPSPHKEHHNQLLKTSATIPLTRVSVSDDQRLQKRRSQRYLDPERSETHH